MRAYVTALVTLGLTLVLMLVGGVVHATGSSLACPDWPLCYGSAFPQMVGGVLFEHSHRLTASAVGTLTLALAVVLVASRWQGRLRIAGFATLALAFVQGGLMGAAVSTFHSSLLLWVALSLTGVVALALVVLGARSQDTLPVLGLAAFETVVVQGLLGGLTVMMRLPTAVSTAHLATSLFFFSLLVTIVMRLRAGKVAPMAPLASRWPVAVAAFGVYLQCILGALVRHTASGMACGDSLVGCAGNGGPALLHYSHRLFALFVTALIIAATLRPLKAARLHPDDPRRGLVRFFGLGAHLLVTLQVGLGLFTVASFIALPLVTAHLGVAALLMGDLVALFLVLGPLGTQDKAAKADQPAGAGALLGAQG